MWDIKDGDGCIKIKAVRCNKAGCTKCPHGWYAYHVVVFFGKEQWKYLGKADSLGRPVKRPADDLRPIYKND